MGERWERGGREVGVEIKKYDFFKKNERKTRARLRISKNCCNFAAEFVFEDTKRM